MDLDLMWWKVRKESNIAWNGYLWKTSLLDIEDKPFVRIERWGTPQSDFPYCNVLCQISELVGEGTASLSDSEADDLAHACMGIATSGDLFELLSQIQSEGEVV